MSTLQDVTFDAMSRLAAPVTVIEVTLSLNTGIYASGDVLADTQVVAGATRHKDGYGKIIAAVVLDKDAQAQGLDLIFLKANVSLGTENSAPSMSDADAENLLGAIEVESGDFVDLTNNQIALAGDLYVPIVAASGTSDIYMAAMSRGTGTYTASGIVVQLFIEQY